MLTLHTQVKSTKYSNQTWHGKISLLKSILFTILYCSVFFRILLFGDGYQPLYAQENNAQTDISAKPKIQKYRHSEIDVGAVFFFSVSADTVYAYLYKNPVLGGINLGYTYKNPRMEHAFNIRGGVGRLYSPYKSVPDYPALDDFAVQATSRYTSSFRIWHQKKIALLLGHGLHFSGNAWIPDNETYDVIRYTWSFHSGIGLNTLMRWDINAKNKLKFNLYTPFFGIAWRPTYSGYTLREESLLETNGMLSVLFANPSFISFHNFVSADLRISYEYIISPLLALQIEYYGRLEYISIPRDRLEVQNNVILGITFRI